MSCDISVENHFGPQVRGCLGDFDFTLLFEETVLSISLAGLALFLLPGRISHLFKQPLKVKGGRLLYGAKLITFAVYAAIQIALIVLISLPQTPKTRASIACAVLNFASTLGLWLLSHLEHTRAVRPSVLLNTFLLFSLPCDIIRDRTLWAIRDNRPFAIVFTVSVVLKFVVLLLETFEKRGLLRNEYADYPPEATAGVYSRNFFVWLCPLLIQGFSKELDVNQLDPNDKALIPDSGLQERWKRCNQSLAHSLLWVYTVHYRWYLAAAVVPRLALTGFRFAQPFLVQTAVEFISEPTDPMSANRGYGLIAAYAIVYIGIAIAGANSQHKTYRLITAARGTLVNLIYQRTLELNTISLNESKAVTLMSADVERVGTGLRTLHEIWASPLEIGLSLWLISGQIGVAAVSAGLVTLLCTGAAVLVASGAGARQNSWLQRIQKRVDATANMLGSMKGVKMSGLADDLRVNIKNLREEEISSSLEFRKLLVKIVNLSYMSTAMTPVVGFGVFSILAKIRNTRPLDVEIVFTCLTLFELLAAPVSVLIDTLAGVMSAVGSFQRIGKYLATEPRIDPRLTLSNAKMPQHTLSNSKIRPRKSSLTLIGRPVNEELEKPPAANLMVVRNSSAGWNKETPPILTGLSFEIKKSQLTMIIGPVGCGKSTLLKTLLGETPSAPGVIEKAFEDAAYCSQTPWLTNGTVQQNILGVSEMDPTWYETVVAACALDTDIAQFNGGDQMMVGSKGISLSGGQQMRLALARAVYSKKSVVFLDDIFSGLDSTTEEVVFNGLFSEEGLFRKHKTTVVLATNAVHRLSAADYIIALGSNGQIMEKGSFEELNASKGYIQSLALSKRKASSTRAPSAAPSKSELPNTALEGGAAGGDRRIGDFTIYKYYIQTFGWWRTLILVFFAATYGFGAIFPQVWIQWWARSNGEHPNARLGYYLGIYAMFGVIAVLALLGACWHLVINLVPLTARKMHDILLQTVLSAPMSFFQNTDTGITINRFSQDLELIDMELPLSVINVVLIFSVLVAQTIVILVTGKYIAASLPFCIAIVYFIQKYYLRTSRQLRFLEIEAKSPLFSHFLELLEGLTTVRAFGWGDQYINESRRALEVSQRPYYLLYCVQRWLSLVLDLTVAGIALVMITVAVQTRGDINAGLIGLALVNIVSFSTNLKLLITNWTLLETSIGAVSRVRSFAADTESENYALPDAQPEPPSEWPQEGSISFNNISATFESSGKSVLRNISFQIKGGQRIGICGRSGSGKSSLISTLFRMLDLSTGSITIDNLDISTIPRQSVRFRLNAIPQEPYLLAGTVRLSVDPLRRTPDTAIITALQKVQLWDYIQLKGGLDADLSADFFSHGQRQLICLARAMIRQSSVLVLDEATASVDVKTDELMQKIIREEFPTQTIIAVAHRLDTVTDFDMVAVLDHGELVEYDSPRNLLGRQSKFRELYLTQKGEDAIAEEEEMVEVEL
ncbi:putative ABC multidrug transporter [Xylogone sp. PMI_703]|nr:putative ABC multidrug transporter [Xylogone sp. PMI_703]